jgi:hypothetical protein
MAVFTLPSVLQGALYCLNRQPPDTYRLMFAQAYIEVAILNPSTPIVNSVALSPRGRPLVWIEEAFGTSRHHSLDQYHHRAVPALLDPDRAIVKKTGRTRRVYLRDGIEIQLVEVEILLEEDQLSRSCRYCDRTELLYEYGDERMVRCSGEGYDSVYCCRKVLLNLGCVEHHTLISRLSQCSTRVAAMRRAISKIVPHPTW